MAEYFKPLAGNIYTISPQYDTPTLNPEGKFGPFWSWGLYVDGKEMYWSFGSQKVHDMIVASGMKKGDVFSLAAAQQATQDGKKYNAYCITPKNTNQSFYSHAKTAHQDPVPEQDVPPPSDVDGPDGFPQPKPPVDRDSFPPPDEKTDGRLEKMESIMNQCLHAADNMAVQGFNINFTSEDVRSIAISMFIQMSR